MERKKPASSRKSSRSRSHSRARSDAPPLSRILSSQFPDDHSVYHHEDGEGLHIDEDVRSFQKTESERRGENLTSIDDHDHLTGATDTEKIGGSEDDSVKESGQETEPEDVSGSKSKEFEEIRGGVLYEHDVEAAAPAVFAKTKSTTSMKDPNLVSTRR